ncbi:DivIVA domain-containing protein [Kribbella sp. HUAS MG21]|uniref:Cell wall synthesis protein Wag31 n=1 Tax=Kribbella sp. HUAS MG21 TaxID=3160966 RepID=A0AAU7T4V1_9ACTN
MLRPQFRVRRIGQRYDCAEVDAFVDRVLATAERRSVGPEMTADDVRAVAFSTPFLGPGYSVEEVDHFLAEAERWLPSGTAPDTAVAGGGTATAGGPVAGGQQAPQFSTVRLQEGYAMDEVDEFVDRLLATVNGQPVARPVTADEVRNVQFRPVRFSEGYDVMEVDAFLDTAQAWLRDGMR